MRLCVFGGILLLANTSYAQVPAHLGKALLFHASYDRNADADYARGDARIYTARSLKREKVQAGLHDEAISLSKTGGRYGGFLALSKKTDQIIFYRGARNVPFADSGFSGTVSFWMRVSPQEDLPAGYVDPLQITDKKWNDASLFVDFTKETPRQFRLGVFSDFAFWNPQNRKWEDVPEKERPMVPVKQLPFSGTKWTHVAFTLSDVNRADKKSSATLYLDGNRQGELQQPLHFSWQSDKVAIMIGINYVGGMDDFAIFDRALADQEIQQLRALPKGVDALR